MQIFMIQEKFRQKSQILTINWVFVAIDFKNCNFIFLISVYLIAWRMKKRTNLPMSLELALQCKETEAKIANVKAI